MLRQSPNTLVVEVRIVRDVSGSRGKVNTFPEPVCCAEEVSSVTGVDEVDVIHLIAQEDEEAVKLVDDDVAIHVVTW